MAQFDAYAIRLGKLVMDVQSDFAPIQATRIVVPLLPIDAAPRPNGLTPIVEIAGRRHLMATHLLSAAETRYLGRPIANLAPHRDEITRALDLLFTGF